MCITSLNRVVRCGAHNKAAVPGCIRITSRGHRHHIVDRGQAIGDVVTLAIIKHVGCGQLESPSLELQACDVVRASTGREGLTRGSRNVIVERNDIAHTKSPKLQGSQHQIDGVLWGRTATAAVIVGDYWAAVAGRRPHRVGAVRHVDAGDVLHLADLAEVDHLVASIAAVDGLVVAVQGLDAGIGGGGAAARRAK